MGLGPRAIKNFYNTKMAHNLVSVYSVFFQPHSTSESITINSIHIIDQVYTCIIISSDSSLAPSLSMSRHQSHTPFPLNYLNETKAAKGRTSEALCRECKPPPSPHFLHVDYPIDNWSQNIITSTAPENFIKIRS